VNILNSISNKKQLAGILALLFVVFCLILYVLMRIEGKKCDVESKAYIDKTVPLIVNEMDSNVFRKYLSEDWNKISVKDKTKTLDSLFKMIKDKYGKFVKYEGSAGESVRKITLLKGIVMEAKYFCKVKFEYGSIQIKVQLIKRHGLWKILSFNFIP
jgi:hypothetical protein